MITLKQYRNVQLCTTNLLKPLIDYYRNSGLYEEINGLQDVDAVFADIIKGVGEIIYDYFEIAP